MAPWWEKEARPSTEGSVDDRERPGQALNSKRAVFGGLAQLVERLHGMQEVNGSTPLSSTPQTLIQFHAEEHICIDIVERGNQVDICPKRFRTARHTSCRQTCGKPCLPTPKHWRLGKISRHLPATNGFAGRSPLKLQKRGRSMSTGSCRNLSKGCVALAVGTAAFTGRIRH
jgi:hypothetical protein